MSRDAGHGSPSTPRPAPAAEPRPSGEPGDTAVGGTPPPARFPRIDPTPERRTAHLPPPAASTRFPDAPRTPGAPDGQEAPGSPRAAGGPEGPRSGAGPRPPKPAAPPARAGATASGTDGPVATARPTGSSGPAAADRPGEDPGPRAAPDSTGAPTGSRPDAAASRTRPAADTAEPPSDTAHPPAAPPRPGTAPVVPPRPSTPPRSARPSTSAPGKGPSAMPGAPPPERPEETTTRLRPVPPAAPPPRPTTPPAAPRRPAGPVDPRPDPAAGRPFVFFARPEHAGRGGTGVDDRDEPTTGPRPRTRPRVVAAAACLVLGLGLIGGAVAGSWLTDDEGRPAGAARAYGAAAQMWHEQPVDRLFPPLVRGEGAGPGGADRTWTRIAVAPDSGCAEAFDPLLLKALGPVGCRRLLRATYTDATRSHVTTVGLLFTRADADRMRALRDRFTKDALDRREDLMPRPYAAKGTAAADFGDRQRASWALSVLTDAPVVVYAVSGFADGRTVTDPQPAAEAMDASATTAPAQSGLGFEARGLADRIERGLRTAVAAPEDTP